MTGVDAVPAAASQKWAPVWRAVRVGLALLWVGWAALAWWSAPRGSTVAAAHADLAGGRVAAYGFVDGVGGVETVWFAPIRMTASDGQPGRMFLWRTPDRRVHYTPVATTAQGRQPTEAEQIQLALPDGARGRSVIPALPAVLSAILVLGSLGILIGGPAPGLGTRWFWFWLGGVPFGLGLLLWLATDRPWTEPPPRPLHPKTGRPARHRGYVGFALALLAGLAVSILLALLHPLPEWLLPTPLP